MPGGRGGGGGSGVLVGLPLMLSGATPAPAQETTSIRGYIMSNLLSSRSRSKIDSLLPGLHEVYTNLNIVS